MTEIRSHKSLIAWQKAMQLIKKVYLLTAGFPAEEKFGLVSQARHSAVSIAANIAEGHGRRTRKDFTQFLDVARGSANELETHLLIGVELGMVSNDDVAESLAGIDEVQRLLRGLANSLEKSDKTRVKP